VTAEWRHRAIEAEKALVVMGENLKAALGKLASRTASLRELRESMHSVCDDCRDEGWASAVDEMEG